MTAKFIRAPKVKVTKVYPMVCRPHRPLRSGLLKIAGMTLVTLALLLAYNYGERNSPVEKIVVIREDEGLKAELLDLKQRNQELQLQLAMTERHSLVDKYSDQGARETIKALTDQIARLEEEVILYQGIMSPADGDEGVRIRQASLMELNETGSYRIRFMLTQTGNDNSLVTGTASIYVQGKQADERLEIPLQTQDSMAFSYRYFQELSSEFRLPVGFDPEQLSIVLQKENGQSLLDTGYQWSDLLI